MAKGTTTRATLLSRVRDNADAEAWTQFEATYREMLIRFCRSRGLQHADAEDIIQLVFTKLVTGLRNFEYDPKKGRFRDYLFRCTRSAVADWSGKRSPGPLAEPVAAMLASDDGDAATVWEREWIDHHYRLALAEVKSIAEPQSVRVLESALAGNAPAAIAQSLGMTDDAVYKSLQRMRDRMRDVIARQVRDEDSAES